MKNHKRNKTARLIIIISIIILGFVVIILLGRWTNSINKKQRLTDLRTAMKEAISQYGEKGLLEMAGIPVNNIYFAEDGSPLFSGESGTWTYTTEELQNKYVFEKCNSAVVHIDTSGTSIMDYLDTTQKTGIGSGFFISSDGYICTSEHVVNNAAFITVTIYDGTQYSAQIVGTDPENDIAVIKIDNEDRRSFEYLTFDDSDKLVMGQKVLALGNPFGYDRTLSSGIISGLSRPIRSDAGKVLLGMIQTDAQIYPGNSGGPLLNTVGNVIGICSSVYNMSGNQGLNFAVSSNSADISIQDIIKYGEVRRGWLDIVPIVLTKQIVDYSDLKVSSGLLVSEVLSGGKAQAAGIKGGVGSAVRYGANSYIFLGGDIITKVNETEIADISDLYTALSTTRPGEKVSVVVNRNGVDTKLNVELVERTTDLIRRTMR